MHGFTNLIKGKNGPCKSPEISAVLFLICQVTCSSMIEETAHVIGNSQFTRRRKGRGRMKRERDGGEDEGRGLIGLKEHV